MSDSSRSPTQIRTTFRQAFLIPAAVRSYRYSPPRSGGCRQSVTATSLTGVALTLTPFVTLLVVGVLVDALSNVLDRVVASAFRLTGSRPEPSETPT